MNEMQTCAACGHTSYDVKRTVVELEPPYRMVHDPISGQPMPERFTHEPRCTDPIACDERQEVRG